MFDNYIDTTKNEMIKNLQKLIQIPSVNSPASEGKPFGIYPAKALENILSLGEKLGFQTKNIDGYCGYIEFGDGTEILGIIGHLDVVPEGENWTYPPFSGTINNNKIYGRGAIDDKGPVIASLYAMKAVMDYCKEKNHSLNKKVRLILGLNEENDWKCINYYKTHEKIPSIGFSPDADFPCIYAEKGILSPILEMEYTKPDTQNIIIENIDCNKNPLNVVPKFCSVTLSISTSLDINHIISKTKSFIDKNKFNIEIEKIKDSQNSPLNINSNSEYSTIKINSYGVQAHAAHPDLGVNAISRLILLLNYIFEITNTPIPLFHFFAQYIGTEYNGESLGISRKDESGNLTLNVGNFSLENNTLSIGMNLRIPIHTKIDEIQSIFSNKATLPIKCKFIGKKDPLYISKDSPLVTTLCNIFNHKTNSNLEPIAIGGATYARAFPNCVSFGANLPNQKDMCHQTDEFISIDNLILASKIYAEAIYQLVTG